MRSPLPLLLLCLLGLGCSSDPEAAPATGDAAPTGDCARFAVKDAVACAEARFWDAFQQPGLPLRKASEQTLAAVLAKADAEGGDKKGRALLHFRLGQLRLAMALENDQRELAMKAQTVVIGEFEAAMGLDPYDGIIAPWKDAMEIAMAAIMSDWERGVTLAQRGFDNVALNPLGNTLSLSGTTIGFPLSTGVPQKTVALLDAWTCSGVPWCAANTEHAPWARPGLEFHFAEAYARVGDRDQTKAHLDAALAAPGAAQWPYRSVAADARRDIDGFLEKFAALGEDGSAFAIAYANQKYGCVFCHQK
jgi:hypothetical protein